MCYSWTCRTMGTISNLAPKSGSAALGSREGLLCQDAWCTSPSLIKSGVMLLSSWCVFRTLFRNRNAFISLPFQGVFLWTLILCSGSSILYQSNSAPWMTFWLDAGVLSGATLCWYELIINTCCIPQIPLGSDANFLKVYYDPFHVGPAHDMAISHPSRAKTSCHTGSASNSIISSVFPQTIISDMTPPPTAMIHVATRAFHSGTDRLFCLQSFKSKCIQVFLSKLLWCRHLWICFLVVNMYYKLPLYLYFLL